ncbi:uncharacterized mitochondrial protein-like protein [Tanacetum coccineum]
MFCYYVAFLTLVEPKTYKDALTQSCWIEAMQEELNEFECLEVWELVPRPDKVMVITLKWIYKSSRGIFLNQSKYALESVKKYGMESCDPMDTPMVEKSKLDEDTQEKAVDPTHCCGMVGTVMYLTSSRPDLVYDVCADHAGYQDTRCSTSGSMQLLGDRLVSWSSKRSSNTKVFTPFANPERQFWSRKDITPIAVHNIYSFYESESSESESEDLSDIDIETLTLEQYLALNRAAKRWLGRTPSDLLKTWDELKQVFIQRFCPPSLNSKQIGEIYNF